MRQMMPLTKLNQAKIQTPPFWALGYHLCRNTSNQESSFLNNIEALSNTTLSNKTVPYDSDCIGQSFMKTAFGVNINSYEEDDGAFLDLQKDFDTLKR
jgi:hypothetical protein